MGAGQSPLMSCATPSTESLNLAAERQSSTETRGSARLERSIKEICSHVLDWGYANAICLA